MRKQSTRAHGAQAPKKTSTPKRAASPATRTRRPPATPKTAGRAGGREATPAAGPHASGCQCVECLGTDAKWRGDLERRFCPVKVQLGCGNNLLDGWQNFGRDPDIKKPLPFETRSVDFIYLEHVIEHVDYLAAMRFFVEAKRVLRSGGVLRLAFPDVYRSRNLTEARSIMLEHGHAMAWVPSLIRYALLVSGFAFVDSMSLGQSAHAELLNLESGIERPETAIVEATK